MNNSIVEDASPSLDSCSYSSDTMWPHMGNSSTLAFFLPKSKILILGSEFEKDLLNRKQILNYMIVLIWWNQFDSQLS